MCWARTPGLQDPPLHSEEPQGFLCTWGGGQKLSAKHQVPWGRQQHIPAMSDPSLSGWQFGGTACTPLSKAQCPSQM
jgi:hypothetical protein